VGRVGGFKENSDEERQSIPIPLLQVFLVWGYGHLDHARVHSMGSVNSRT